MRSRISPVMKRPSPMALVAKTVKGWGSRRRSRAVAGMASRPRAMGCVRRWKSWTTGAWS